MKVSHRIRRQDQQLLPECLDDYISKDNPVRALDIFVDKLDLGALGFEVKAEHTVGAPTSFERPVLLKLLIYGYLNQIRSSRKIEAETGRNLEVIWLTEKAQPDHWTINEFRKVNLKAFKAVLRDFHKVCGQLKLFGKELEAIDGSFFKALNNKSNNYTQSKLDRLETKIDAAIDAYNEALDQEVSDKDKDKLEPHQSSPQEEVTNPAEVAPTTLSGKTKDRQQHLCFEQAESDPEAESGEAPKNLRAEGTLEELQAKKRRIGELRQEAAQSPSGQVSGNDPDSRLLKKGNQSVVGHNVQSVVDAEAHLLSHVEIVQAGNDRGQLEPMARAACEAIGIEPGEEDPLEVVADGGYYNSGQIHECEEAWMQVHVPAGKTTAIDEPGYRVGDFEYDTEADEYVCPEGQRLWRHSDTTDKKTTYRVYYNTAACRECPCREDCTKGKYRKIRISQYREVEQKVARRLEEHPEIYARRKGLAEHPFGTIKSVWGYGQFMVTGAEKCDGELNLMAFCYNWKRVLSVVGMDKLIEAIIGGLSALTKALKAETQAWEVRERLYRQYSRVGQFLVNFPKIARL